MKYYIDIDVFICLMRNIGFKGTNSIRLSDGYKK